MPGGKDENRHSPQPVTPGCRSLLIIADDLTGTCDAAVAFTCACDSVTVQITGDSANSPGLHAMTTGSRDLSGPEAALRLRNLVERLPEDTQLFKKIDSVFRGNTATEIATALHYAQFDLAILAPAYPAVGRTMRQGILYIHDAGGERTVPIGELLTQAGCSFAPLLADESPDRRTASLRRCIETGVTAVLCDASTQLDLIRIVRAAHSLNKRILWIGSGGLAHAIAAELPPLTTKPDTRPRVGSTIFFIGSPHPVSRAQVDHLRQTAGIAEHHPNASHKPADDLIVAVLLGKTTPEEIRRATALHDPAQIGCLFLTGGDTAHFVCRALAIHSLRLLREFAPGVPLAVAEGGPFDGVSVVLKSGGFGESDLLCRLLETYRATLEVTA